MARGIVAGEKPLDWIGSSKKDFVAFPDAVKSQIGNALGVLSSAADIRRRNL